MHALRSTWSIESVTEMAAGSESWAKMLETRQRLEKCWKLDVDWKLFPSAIKNVSYCCIFLLDCLIVVCDVRL